jgi:multidrug efflux pump subunit AcrA (membrane-fusion protein)
MLSKKITFNSILTIVAIIGILSGIYMLILDQKKVPIAQPVTPPSISPYKYFISGAGIVEAASENIGLGTMVSAVVKKILVKKGDIVKKGTPLFMLNSDQAVADLQVKIAQWIASKAALGQSEANLKLAEDEWALVNVLKDKRGVTKDELITRRDNVIIAKAGVENAKALLEAARAQVNESQVIVDFYTVCAPLDCEIMQINTHPGEYAAANPLTVSSNSPSTPSQALMLVGNVSRYHVRVDVDENDAWRFKKSEPAILFLRGNIQYHTELKFEYIEPYVIPKASLTGDPTERVDTRVLQVIYSFDPKAVPVYLGQEVDVYIQAAKISPNAQYGGPLTVSR